MRMVRRCMGVDIGDNMGTPTDRRTMRGMELDSADTHPMMMHVSSSSGHERSEIGTACIWHISIVMSHVTDGHDKSGTSPPAVCSKLCNNCCMYSHHRDIPGGMHEDRDLARMCSYAAMSVHIFRASGWSGADLLWRRRPPIRRGDHLHKSSTLSD